MKMRSLFFLIPLLLGALPQTLSACPICMGAPDSPAASAVNNAIFIMFGVLGIIFTGIGSVFFSLYRRAKHSSQQHEEMTTSELDALGREFKEASQHA